MARWVVQGDGQVVGRGEPTDDRPRAYDLRGPFVRRGQVPGEDVGRHVVDVGETAVVERPVGQVGTTDARFERLVRVGGGDATRGVNMATPKTVSLVADTSGSKTRSSAVATP